MIKRLRKYPFFFIIDDGGFDYAVPEERKCPVTMDTYYSILQLAKEFGIKIPICFTMKYLDKENISGRSAPLLYVDELIDFLKDNFQYIEIGYHGYTHGDKGCAGEFYYLDKREAVPESVQREHIEKSKRIFEYWGLNFPELCVPPYHAWQEGTTDKILSEYGVKYLISYKKLTFNQYTYEWKESKFLEFFPRLSLGLNGCDYDLNSKTKCKIRFYPQTTLFDFVRCHIIPQSFLTRLRIHKSFIHHPVHSYMTHIGNFSHDGVSFWREVLTSVIKNKYLHLCKTNQEATVFYRNLNA